MRSPKVALNYFQSSEFWNTVQLLGVMSIPYVLEVSEKGLQLETGLKWLFVGVLGVVVKGRKDLESNPNLYTPVGVAGTDPKQAQIYVAQNIAIEQATREVIPKTASDRIKEVADDIIATTQIPDLLKPYAKKASRDFLGRFFK